MQRCAHGNAVSEVHRHTTSNGDVMRDFRMVVHERRYDRTLERYVGGESSYLTLSLGGTPRRMYWPA